MSAAIFPANGQEEIRKQMKQYRSLPEYMLDGIGAVLAGRFRSKYSSFLPIDASGTDGDEIPSYWINGLLIASMTFLVGWLSSKALGETLSLSEIQLGFWAAITGALALIANKVNIRRFLDTFSGPTLDKIESTTDLNVFAKWLEINFRIHWPLVVGLIIGPILAYVLIINWQMNNKASLHIGTTATIGLACIQSVWVAYYLYPFYVSLPAHLSRYHFDLYATDPSSSEVVGRLSQLLTFIMYITLAYIVQLTIGLAQFNILNWNTAFIFSLFVWAPTVLLYAAGQFHISSVISRAKWEILNEIQTKIESLYVLEDIPDKDTLERLEKLMDYHDRIKNTPNSAINLRSGLNFLNSLLLPVIAFVIGNLDKIVSFLANPGK